MIVLGSQSPRRREIFNFFSLPHTVAIPHFDENTIPFSGEPEQYVCALSEGKAASLIEKYPDQPILAADTVVFKEGKIYGKPRNAQHAFEMLQELSGNWHTVYTALTLCIHGRCFSKAEATQVQFNLLTPKQIRKYHQCTEWEDKAGAYAIQNGGAMIIRQIKGCYYNVMGLPINTLYELLSKIGIDLWDYLKKP